MAELIKLVLEYLQKYFVVFINLVASPRVAPNRLGLLREGRLRDSFTFFGISAVISFVVKIPFTPSTVEVWSYIAQDSIWKIILVCGAAVGARIAWFLYPGRYSAYLAGNCYFLGTLSIVVPLWFIVFDSPMGSSYPNILAGTLLAFLLAILIWSVGAWLSFGMHNHASLWSSLLRFPLFMILLTAFSPLALFIRAGTVQKLVAAAGGVDYEGNDTKSLLVLLSFGLYP